LKFFKTVEDLSVLRVFLTSPSDEDRWSNVNLEEDSEDPAEEIFSMNGGIIRELNSAEIDEIKTKLPVVEQEEEPVDPPE
jgi:hypothetical protein